MSELRRIRLERGFPQDVVARRARIGQTTLSGFERGERPIPKKIAMRLARILGTDLDAIVVPVKENAR